MERTELLKLQGHYQEVLPALDQIRKVTTTLQADLTAQLAQAAARGNDPVTALEAIEIISDLEDDLPLDDSQSIILAQINTDSLDPKYLEQERELLRPSNQKTCKLDNRISLFSLLVSLVVPMAFV